MDRIDIETCDDIRRLRGIAIEQYRTIKHIKEIVGKLYYLGGDVNISDLREELQDNDNRIDEIMCSECCNSSIRDFLSQMRDPTPEENKSISDYISSISKPTGLNVFDMLEEGDQ